MRPLVWIIVFLGIGSVVARVSTAGADGIGGLQRIFLAPCPPPRRDDRVCFAKGEVWEYGTLP